MKAGATYKLVVSVNADATSIDKMIITIKGQKTDKIQKVYPGEVEFKDGRWRVPLTQEDTESLAGQYIDVEAQINYSNKSVAKTTLKSIYIAPTLATEFVAGSTPDDREVTDVNLEIIGEVVEVGRSISTDTAELSHARKYPLGAAYFNYTEYFVGKDMEESARKLAKYDLICCEGAISKWTASTKRQDELALVQLVREYNPNVKFFRYISVNSKYDSTLDKRVPINKYDMYQQIRATLHMGGTWTTEKDSDGYDIITGGIPYDGIFWDEFDSHAGITDLNEGDEASWSSVVEKQNDLIEEARRLGLCSFGNAWYVIEMVSGKPMSIDPVYNPDSLPSSIGEDDYLLVESCEFYPKEPIDGYGYWSTAASAYKIYNYMQNYYPAQKAKLVSFSSGGYNMSIEEKQRALTWMIFDTVAMGGHYICFDQGLDYELPDILQQFYYNNRSNATFSRIAEGHYQMKINGHTLVTKRDSGLTGKVNLKSLGLSHIYIDNIEIKNIFTTAPELGYSMESRVGDVEEQLALMDKDIKQNVSRYQRLMIDDWVPMPTPDAFPNILPLDNGSANQMTITRDVYNFAGAVANSWGSYKWTIDVTAHQGKTLEIGCSKFTTTAGNKQIAIVIYDAWANRVCLYPTTANASLVGNTSGLNISYQVSAVQNTITIGLFALGAAVNSTFEIEDMYVIDPSSVEELQAKSDYTNYSEGFDGWVDSTSWVKPDDTSTVTYTVDAAENDIEITYNENAYAAYKGICVIMKPQGVLTPGSTWEIGCKSFVSNAGDNIRIRVYPYATKAFTPYIIPSKADKSALYDMECPHITVTIPDTAVDAQGCYVEILNLSSVSYNTLADGSKEYHKAVIKDFYMYDVNEENVIVRGVNPANTWLQICRVTDARLAADTSLVSNAIYITDSGKMFITDFNGKKVNLTT